MRTTDTLHRLPTHLGVRDPVLWTLDEVQLLKVAAGVRAALVTGTLLGAIACALLRIDGRSLDEWLLLAGRYWARPHALVWRPRRTRHPWARATFGSRSTVRTAGARYCLRQIRVRWPEPARDTGVAP